MSLNLFAKKRGRKKGQKNKFHEFKSEETGFEDIQEFSKIDKTEQAENEIESISDEEFEIRQQELINKTKQINQPELKEEKQEIPKEENNEDIFNSIRNDINKDKEEHEIKENENKERQLKPQAQNQQNITGAINGRLLIVLVDIVVPMVFVFLMGKKKKFKAKDIRLDADEKNDIMPLADIVAQDIALKSPQTAFAIIIIAMYGFKVMQFEE